MLRLRTYETFPPGGYDYRDPSTNHYFQAEGGIRQTATRVMEFRKANNLPRSTWEECAADIEQFVIARLGNDDKWVYDTDAPPPAAMVQRRASGGGCCGAKIP